MLGAPRGGVGGEAERVRDRGELERVERHLRRGVDPRHLAVPGVVRGAAGEPAPDALAHLGVDAFGGHRDAAAGHLLVGHAARRAGDVVHAAAEAVAEVEPVIAAEARAAGRVVAPELRIDRRQAAGGRLALVGEDTLRPREERRRERDRVVRGPDGRAARGELAGDEAVGLGDRVEVVERGEIGPVAGRVARPHHREDGVPEEEAAEVAARGHAGAERDDGLDLGLMAGDVVHLAAGDIEGAVAEAADEVLVGCVVFHGGSFRGSGEV